MRNKGRPLPDWVILNDYLMAWASRHVHEPEYIVEPIRNGLTREMVMVVEVLSEAIIDGEP